MKNYFFKFYAKLLLLLFLGLAILGSTVEYFSKDYFYSWYAFVNHKRDVSEGKLDLGTIRYLAMGNSQMQSAFDARQIKNSFNLSYPGTTIIENYYLLKRYLANNKSPEIIVYGFFPQNNYLYFYNFGNLHLRYGAYRLAEVWDIYKNSIKTENYLMLEEEDSKVFFTFKFWYTYISFKFNFPNHYQRDLHSSLFQKPSYIKYEDFYRRSEEQKGFYTFYTGREINETIAQRLTYEQERRKDRFIIEPILELYLDKFVALTQKYNIKIMYLVMPNHSKLLRAIGYQTAIQSHQYYDRYFNNVLNAYKVEDIVLNDSEFLDIQHYNESGAREITKHLKERIEVITDF